MALKRSHTYNAESNCKKLKIYRDHDPDFINYILVPSLKSMTTVNIATVLCKQSAVIDAIREHSMKYDPVKRGIRLRIRGTFYNESLLEIQKKILNNLALLPLPDVLKLEVSNMVKPIQLQLLNWIRHGRKDIEYIDSVCWSNEGTIDKIKTLKHLIDKDMGQHVESIYKLACDYCSEENVQSLWNKLPEETKHFWCRENIYKSYKNHLVAYWTHVISSDLSEFLEKITQNDKKQVYNFNNSINCNMFHLALFTKNILALKYFWNKLTFVEISSNFNYWIELTVNRMKRSDKWCYQAVCEDADMLYFLLSKTNTKTEQKRILQENVNVILKSLFLHWPWQRVLLPTINLSWDHIDAECYFNLLNSIAWGINKKTTTEHLLLSKLWSDSPANLKKCFIQNVLKYKTTHVFCKLLIVEKVGIFKSILEYGDLEDQKQIIFLLSDSNYFEEVVCSDKLHLFDGLYIDSLSQSDIKCLKVKIVRKYFNQACFKWIKSNECYKVNAFLNWAFDTQEVEHFKNEIMEKVDITYRLLHHSVDYEFVNKFLDWCFGSEEKIHEFKLHFVKESTPDIVAILSEDWHSFEKFVDWCFNSDEEIQNFKSQLFQSKQIWETIFSLIAFSYKFDFIENLFKWRFNSQEENLKEFKNTFALSELWMDVLQRFVSNYKCYDSDWNNWELIKKLFRLVSPLYEDTVFELKKEIALGIDFDDFRSDYKNRSFRVRKKHLFRLLDNESYDITDDYFDSGSSVDTDSSDEHDVSNCDEECLLILTEILNDVESSLK